jgi:NAD(P)-dependent dehydrogenase (short-subunit alcohol dehydrogenase family)
MLAPPPEVFAEGQKSILVTGASTGIGRHLAESLAADGYHVYAGARKDKDLAELDAIENITAVRLDVMKQDQVDAAVALITEKGTGLYGLVNNAGVGGGGEVLDTPIGDQTFVYDVNVEGVYRTTKAFAPLVVESKGRVVTTGSIAGTLASFPGFSAYAGSKHWIEAFTDSFAEEMKSSGGELTDEMKQNYETTAQRELSYKEPDEVTQAFKHALFDDKPLRRYMVVPNEEEQAWTIRTKVNELVQLNHWGPYSYSRDELVKMLDEALAGGEPGE